ncbi:hypothetical protein [Methanosarcina sp.]|uniref:hypothetical protein n=1 Tax=Methanosarcina sp. TaxID=2213 RepID=UPI003BB60837
MIVQDMNSLFPVEYVSYIINLIFVTIGSAFVAKFRKYVSPEQLGKVIKQLGQTRESTVFLLKTVDRLVAVLELLDKATEDGKLSEDEIKKIVSQGKSLLESEEVRKIREEYNSLLGGKSIVEVS